CNACAEYAGRGARRSAEQKRAAGRNLGSSARPHALGVVHPEGFEPSTFGSVGRSKSPPKTRLTPMFSRRILTCNARCVQADSLRESAGIRDVFTTFCER